MDEENKEQNVEQNNNEQEKETGVNAQVSNENSATTEKKDETSLIMDAKTAKVCCSVFLAAFLGSFFAMYFAADKYFAHQFRPEKMPPRIEKERYVPVFDSREFDVFDDFERRIRAEHNEFFNDVPVRPGIRNNLKNYKADISPFSSPVKIKTTKENDKYNIIVSLKPFQNNPDKVKYLFSGNKITVFGKNETIKDNETTNVSFSQDFILPDNADIDGTKKIKDGNKLIISIPFKE